MEGMAKVLGHCKGAGKFYFRERMEDMTNLIFEEERREDKVWLQGIGWRKAIPAGSLKPGIVTIWNGGVTETIKSIQAYNAG